MTPAVKLLTLDEVHKISRRNRIFQRNTTYVMLVKAYYFYCGGRKQKIPAGFLSDGASIPRIFWRILDPPITAGTLIASLKHDFVYQTACTSRKKADRMFWKDMKRAGYPRWKAFLHYSAVRIFGWIPWKKWRTLHAEKRNHMHRHHA